MKKDLTNVTPRAAAETPVGSDAASEKLWPEGLLAMLVTVFSWSLVLARGLVRARFFFPLITW